jgi:katanin p80 WD40 repeat-containing subunit B1
VSGSLDTNVKLWDLRTKNCLYNIKNHHKKVNALHISADSRVVSSGGEDGIAQTFDMKMMRPIYQYEIEAPVLSLDSSSNGQLAIGTMDRLAKVY